MLRYVFDTDHLTLYQHVHPPLLRRFFAHPLGTVGVTVVSVEEAFRGRLAVLSRPLTGPARIQAYDALASTLDLFQPLAIVPFDQAGEQEFQQLLRLRLRSGTRDLKIAAVSLAHRLTLLTRNRRDFARVPGLVLDNWSV
jgi:tRNA(fMet)-specific endonuclease VapC